MFEQLLVAQLRKYIGSELKVAVGEELITGILESVNLEFLTLVESTDDYERETRTRAIVLSQVSYIQAVSDNIPVSL